MPRIIKVRCTGAGKHVNDIDLDKALQPAVVLRGVGLPATPREIPERLVLSCQQCTKGQVILTRAIMEKRLSQP